MRCDIIYLFELIKKDIVILKRIKSSEVSLMSFIWISHGMIDHMLLTRLKDLIIHTLKNQQVLNLLSHHSWVQNHIKRDTMSKFHQFDFILLGFFLFFVLFWIVRTCSLLCVSEDRRKIKTVV